MKQTTYVINLEQGKLLAHAVCAHLQALDRVSYAAPAMVTISKHTYFGAQYIYADRADQVNYYLLGRLPNTRDCGKFGYQPRVKLAYTSELHAQALSGGISITEQTASNPLFAQYHPFGVWFNLTTYPNSILTHDNGLAYQRKPITIELI